MSLTYIPATESTLQVTISGSPVTIGEVTNLQVPGQEAGEIVLTPLSSSYVVVVSSGLIDSGECTFTINFNENDASHAILLGLVGAGTTESWTVTYNNGGTFTFSGFVKSNKPKELTPGGVVQQDFTIRVSGAVVYTAS